MSTLPQELPFDIVQLLKKYDPDNRRQKYFELLLKENLKHNLVSRETSREALETLYAESLLPLEVLPSISGRYLDIGSGGGFPAVPLIIADTGFKSVLIERTQKKASALKRIMLELSLEADIQPVDFESTEISGTFDLITMRLVKISKRIAKKIDSLLKPDSFFIYYSEYDNSDNVFSCRIYSYKLPINNKLKHFTVCAKK